jgi:hypothetical protein
MCIGIIIILILSSIFAGMSILTAPGTAANPEIGGSNLYYTANWDLSYSDGFTLENLTQEKNSVKLASDIYNKNFTDQIGFVGGSFNGTVLTDNYDVALGLIPNYKFSDARGWDFENSSDNEVKSYHDNQQLSGILEHSHQPSLITKELEFSSGVGSGSGTLMTDITINDEIYYSVDKGENFTIYDLNLSGLDGKIDSVTIFSEYLTSNVYAGNYSLHIWNSSGGKFDPLNIIPLDIDPQGVDLLRFEYLNSSMFQLYDTWSELSTLQLYWENNCPQAAKYVNWDRIWVNISYFPNYMINPPANSAYMNSTFYKNFTTPILANEVNLKFEYEVEAAENVMTSKINLYVDGIYVWNETIPPTATINLRTIDLSSYLNNAGLHSLSFELFMEYSTYLPVNCSLKFNEVQILTRNGIYTSQLFNPGADVIWDKISWLEISLPPGCDVGIEIRSGNTSDTSDSSWSIWSPRLSDPTGNLITLQPSLYIQFRLYLYSINALDTPVVGAVNLQYSTLQPKGILTTEELSPFELTEWCTFNSNYDLNGGTITFEYSVNSGLNWYTLPSNGSLSSVPLDTKKIMIRAIFITAELTRTPLLYDFTVGYKTLNHIPTSPTMIYPSDRSFIMSLKPEFNWDAAFDNDNGDNISYTLYYSTDPLFSSDVTAIENIQSLSFIPTTSLLDNKKYYWRVVSVDSHGAENMSSLSRSNIFITNTQNDPPTVPDLISPSNNTTLASNQIMFDWTDSSDPDFGDAVVNYTLEISTDSDFKNNNLKITGITASAYTMEKILANYVFYWRVEALDSNGYSSGFQLNPFCFEIDKPYPKITPSIYDIITGEDFPYNINLYDHVEERFQTQNLSWNLINVDTSLINWNITDKGILNINPVMNSFGKDDFIIELYSDGVKRDNQEIEIIIQSINDPPEIFPELPESLFKTIQGEMIIVNLDNFARDVEDSLDDLYWTVEDINENLIDVKIESNPDIMIIEPYFNSSGTDTIKLLLWDSDGGVAQQNIFLNITPLDKPPSIGDLPDLVIHFDENYYLDLSPYISDPDTPLQDLSISANNEYVGFNPTSPFTAIMKFPESFKGELVKIRFTVSDGQFSVFDDITVLVSDNNIPRKKPIPDIYFNEDTSVTYAFDLDDYYYDIDGDDLSYYFFGNANILVTINNDHSVDLRAVPDWFGYELVTFRASDTRGALVEDTVIITVNSVNDPPIVDLKNLEIMEEINVKMDLTPYITDIDTPFDQITLNVKSEFIEVSGHNLTFYYPKDVNFDIFTLVVFDGIDYTNRTVHVIIHPNQPPVIDEIPDLILHYDYDYKFNLQPYIFDPDNGSEDLKLKIDSEYIQLDLHESLMIIINFPEHHLGITTTIRLEVSDGLLTSIGYFRVKISEDWAPELSKPLPNLVFNEDSVNLKILSLNDYFIDKDDSVLDYRSKSENIYVTFQENGYIDITAKENWYGIEFVTIGAVDDQGAFAEDTIRIEFTPINDAPTIAPIPSQVSDKHDIWTLNLLQYIFDIDTPDDEITIEISSNYIDVSDFILFFNYPNNISYEEVTISVSDGELTSTEIFVVQIKHKESVAENAYSSMLFPLGIILMIISIILLTILILKRRDTVQKPRGRYIETGDYELGSMPYQVRSAEFKDVGGKDPLSARPGPVPVPAVKPTVSPGIVDSSFPIAGKSKDEHDGKTILSTKKKVKISEASSYLIEELKPTLTFNIFNSLVKKGMNGLCITRTHPNIVRKKFKVKDQPIIWLTSSKQVKNESYIPPPSLSRISLVVSNFLQKKEKGVIVLEGFEFLLNRDDFKTVLKLIHFLNDLVITNQSILLVPLDPKILTETDLHMLERDFLIINSDNKIIVSKIQNTSKVTNN